MNKHSPPRQAATEPTGITSEIKDCLWELAMMLNYIIKKSEYLN